MDKKLFFTLEMIGLLLLLKSSVFAFSEPTSSASGMIQLNYEHYNVTIASTSSKMKIEGKRDVVLDKSAFLFRVGVLMTV